MVFGVWCLVQTVAAILAGTSSVRALKLFLLLLVKHGQSSTKWLLPNLSNMANVDNASNVKSDQQ